jgi:heat shock protein HtpX
MTGFLMSCASLFRSWIPLAVIGLIFFNYPNGLVYSTIAIAAVGILAISPVYEYIHRLSRGCRPATAEEWQAITRAWDSVVAAIGQALGDKAGKRFARVKLVVCDHRLPDAFALGRNTIGITRGLLRLASSDISGVLAHEAAHLHFGDTMHQAVTLAAKRLGNAALRILDLLIGMLEELSKGLMKSGRLPAGSASACGTLIGLILCLTVIAARTIRKVADFILRIGVETGLGAARRKEEFRADLFARNIGFGPQLVKFLRSIEALEPTPEDLRSVLHRVHPPATERIDRLLQVVI